jgi:hypothetical protein
LLDDLFEHPAAILASNPWKDSTYVLNKVEFFLNLLGFLGLFNGRHNNFRRLGSVD